MQDLKLRSLLSFAALLSPVLSTSLNVTVIGAANGQSRFECWEMADPFTSSAQAGIVGTETAQLGDVANITYNVIPAGFDSGFHNAPYNQWAVVLQGAAVLTVEATNDSVLTQPGELGLLFFKDTEDVSGKGHGCYYPGVTETIFLQIPTVGGAVPEHNVVYEDAPCREDEFAVLRGWATRA